MTAGGQKHRIAFAADVHPDVDTGRQYWECDCGAAGSVPEFGDVELASERHVAVGDRVFHIPWGES